MNDRIYGLLGLVIFFVIVVLWLWHQHRKGQRERDAEWDEPLTAMPERVIHNALALDHTERERDAERADRVD